LASLAYNGRGVAMATAMGMQIAQRVLGAAAEQLDMPITTLKPTVPPVVAHGCFGPDGVWTDQGEPWTIDSDAPWRADTRRSQHHDRSARPIPPRENGLPGLSTKRPQPRRLW
jgi:hypothetical protein